MNTFRPIIRPLAALFAGAAIACADAPSRSDDAPPAAATTDTARVSDPEATAIADKVMAAAEEMAE